MPAIPLPNIDAGAGAAVVYVNDAADAVENMVVSSPTERDDPASSGDPPAGAGKDDSTLPNDSAATTAERDSDPPVEPPFDQGGELPPSATQDAAATAGPVASNNPVKSYGQACTMSGPWELSVPIWTAETDLPRVLAGTLYRPLFALFADG
ncbi:hypothetical protein EXIGLDRAFT_779754 [Exidia glandulosa HHB12029]|uniref:Uncharacterized protein n=1 Tax=Exidia glandulosa HHB12029 TaxID=1314781 RepID=A0A165BX36_EXIGL|nr:hypothetical protein EXIGLDRAFT_779754 [Exidia glandulosa HHB12029]